MAKGKTRITIKDLPQNKKISKEEMKKAFGGFYMGPPVPMGPDVPPAAHWPSGEDVPAMYYWKPIWKK